MSLVAWLCAILGLVFFALCIEAVVFDIHQAQTGGETISRWCLDAGRNDPIIPASITAVVFLLIGILLGHLWFPQH